LLLIRGAAASMWPPLVVDGTAFPLQEGFKLEFLMLLGYTNTPCPHPLPNGSFKKTFLY